MKDIRPQVLQFARNALGTRVWARARRIQTTRANGRRIRSLAPLTSNYSWNGNSYLCEDFPSDHDQDTFHVLTDRTSSNDFRDREKKARRDCNIGVGECWDLAYAALDANNGLKRVSSYTGNGRIWSNKTISSMGHITGGEILEISPSVYWCTLKFQDDGGFRVDSHKVARIPHTGIIKSANASKSSIELYEQNTIDSNGVRNMLVHVGTYPLLNAEFKDGNQTVLQTIGESPVNQFITRLTAASNIDKFETRKRSLDQIITDMRTFIRGNGSILSKIKIYVPEAP